MGLHRRLGRPPVGGSRDTHHIATQRCGEGWRSDVMPRVETALDTAHGERE